MSHRPPLYGFLFALFPALAFASGTGGVDLSVSTSLLSGSTRELVYADDEVLSELVWPVEGIASLALGAGVSLGGGFRLSASLDAAIPGKSGSMEDSDFMNIPASDIKTHYSRHDTRLDYLVDVSLALSREFDTGLKGLGSPYSLTLIPGIGIRYRACSWSGSDGYTQYSFVDGTGAYEGWSESLPKDYLSGKVIDYSQRYILAFASLAANLPIGSAWSLTAAVSASPFISCVGEDRHFLTFTNYEDRMRGGIFVEPSLTVSWQTVRDTRESRLFISGIWTRFSGLRGKTLTRTNDGDLLSVDKDTGGSDSSVFAVRAGYSFRYGARKAD